MIIINIVKYFIMGILSAYLLIFGLIPTSKYPEFLLEPLEHNWMFIFLFIINYYLFTFDERLGYLLLLANISLIFEIIILNNNQDNNYIENMVNSINLNKIKFIS